MEKKKKVKPAAGLTATGGNVEQRLAATREAKPCTLCPRLGTCPDNRRECPALKKCGVNTVKEM
jgi:hypothetical protein